MKTTKEMIEVMQAFDRGEKIEICAHTNGWGILGVSSDPSWNWVNYDYRVCVEPEIPDSIDWSHVSPKWRFMYRNTSNVACLSEREPVLEKSFWRVQGNTIHAAYFSSLKIGNLPCDKSLVKRPEGV